MARRLTSNEDRVGSPVNKQQEVSFVMVFVACLNEEICTGNYTPTWGSPGVHGASTILSLPCPSPSVCLPFMGDGSSAVQQAHTLTVYSG